MSDIKYNSKYNNGAGYTIYLSSERNEANKKKIKDKLKSRVSSFENFNNLSEERRIELQEDSINLRERFIKDNRICEKYYDIVAYIIVLNKAYRDFDYTKYTSEEILTLLIETVDPTLKLLKISMCSRTDFEIEKKANRLFGFYDSDLIDYEREYARRFYRINKDRMIKKLEP